MSNQLNFYTKENYTHLTERLEKLRSDAQPRWGRMNAGQMLQHLNRAIGVGLGHYEYTDESNFLKRGPVKFLIFNVFKGFPKSSKTPQPLEVTGEYEFTVEKTKLKKTLEEAYNTSSNSDWKGHPYFGPLNRSGWGKLIMLHCDHHFKQFGV